MERTLVLSSLLVALGAPALLAAPPWRAEEAPAQTPVLDKLAKGKLRLADKQPLREHLRAIAGASGAAVIADDSVDPAAPVAVAGARRETASDALDRLCDGQRMSWVVHEGKVIVTEKPRAYPRETGRLLAKRIAEARLVPIVQGELLANLAREEALRKKLKQPITVQGVSTRATRARRALERALGVEVIQLGNRVPTGEFLIAGGRTTGAALLDASCQRLGWRWLVHRGQLLIGPPDVAAVREKLAEQTRALAREYQARIGKFDRVEVTLSASDVPARELLADLERQLGARVFLDKRFWQSERRVTLVAEKRPWAKVRASLARQLVEPGRKPPTWVVTDGDALFLVGR